MVGSGARVVACVNHDTNAIESHKANHPDCIHFIEDVRDFKVVVALRNLVNQLRSQHPECLIAIWASLECTNYSKAKGGMPRDADSRTLAHALYMYIEEINPDYIDIENVREFMSWGPLDEFGRPLSKYNGRDYLRWIEKMKSYGYRYDFTMLNAADFGAYTSRERYFGQFAKHGLPITWPQPTHCKRQIQGGLFDNLKPWKAVREVLDLNDEGESIFTRKKPLVEKSLERIYAGLVKFVAGGEDMFIQKYFSGKPMGKVISSQVPAGAIKTADGHSPVFIKRYNGGTTNNKTLSIDNPIGTLTTMNRFSVVTPCFLTAHYSSGKNIHSADLPCPTISTKDRFTKIETKFIDHQFGNGRTQDINRPTGVITSVPKQNIVTVMPWVMNTHFNNVGSSIDSPCPVITANRKHHYLVNPGWHGHTLSVDAPSPVIIARQDKTPMYIIQADQKMKFFAIPFFEQESDVMRRIRMFMAMYGIIDIKMRMLKIDELLKIQGFPNGYVLKGTQSDRKKYIGNAVVPVVAKAIINAKVQAVCKIFKEAI
jgi:DNA (cytosine-5)-methyltransferase 1